MEQSILAPPYAHVTRTGGSEERKNPALSDCPGAVCDLQYLRRNSRSKFSGPVLAIFSWTINQWSDKRIAADNAGRKLPNEDIVVVHRTDASGTTFVWTDFLSKSSRMEE